MMELYETRSVVNECINLDSTAFARVETVTEIINSILKTRKEKRNRRTRLNDHSCSSLLYVELAFAVHMVFSSVLKYLQ